jgi:hypothetical protein
LKSLADHPQYAMWKARLEAEQADEGERAARRALLDSKRHQWDEAWVITDA